MRIAILAVFPFHVIPGLEGYPPRGHYATWLPQLCQAFSTQSEFELHWLFTTRQIEPREPIRWLNQTFHPLFVPGRLRMLRGFRDDVRAIRARLDRIQPALVHAWGTEDCCGLAAARSGCPWLLSMQGLLGEYVKRSPMHPFVHLQALYERFVLARAREISVESKWGRGVLARMAPRARVHLVEYGVPALFYETKWEPDPARPHALFIGTPDPRKGIEDAVRAFADPRLASAELHVIGDRESAFAQKLERASPPNVRWLGRLSREETAQALSQAWCLVLPTRADTSPNVVKEARVLGLPVVTTREGGQSDYIHDGENGFLVSPGDIPALAGALSRLLANLDLAREMGARHWAEQREHFRPEHTAGRFLALYRQLTSPPA
jgi:glycosyltransferase involved in cell wall biosynthesis